MDDGRGMWGSENCHLSFCISELLAIIPSYGWSPYRHPLLGKIYPMLFLFSSLNRRKIFLHFSLLLIGLFKNRETSHQRISWSCVLSQVQRFWQLSLKCKNFHKNPSLKPFILNAVLYQKRQLWYTTSWNVAHSSKLQICRSLRCVFNAPKIAFSRNILRKWNALSMVACKPWISEEMFLI